MNAQEAAQALAELINRPGGYTAADLRALASQVATDAPGSLTLAYSGGTNGDIARTMAAADSNIRIIDNTQAKIFLNSDGFLQAVANKFGTTVDNLGTVGTPANNFLFGGTNSVWSDASARFVAGGSGELRSLSVGADPTRIFGATELPAALSNGNYHTINGVPRTDLVGLANTKGLSAAFETVNAASLGQSQSLLFGTAPDGSQVVGTKNYFHGSGISGVDLPAGTTDVTPGQTRFADIADANRTALQRGVGHLTSIAGKAGVIGSLASLFFAAKDADAANAQGNTALAQDIMVRWAASFAGDLAVSWAFAGLTAAGLTAAAAAGLFVLSAPVSLVVIVGAGIIGGLVGDGAGQNIVNLFSDPGNVNPSPNPNAPGQGGGATSSSALETGDRLILSSLEPGASAAVGDTQVSLQRQLTHFSRNDNVNVDVVPIYDEFGAVTGYLGTIRDASDNGSAHLLRFDVNGKFVSSSMEWTGASGQTVHVPLSAETDTKIRDTLSGAPSSSGASQNSELNVIDVAPNGDTVSTVTIKFSESTGGATSVEIDNTNGNQTVVLDNNLSAAPAGFDLGANQFYIDDLSDNKDTVSYLTGVSLADLAAANPGVDLENLQIGQVLNLPSTTNTLSVAVTATGGLAPGGVLQGIVESNGTHFIGSTDFGALNEDQTAVNASGETVQDNTHNAATAIGAGYVRPGDETATEDAVDLPTLNDLDLGAYNNAVPDPVDLGLDLVDLDFGGQLTLPTDPLVLDLNGDGVRLTAHGTDSVLFDIDHDGNGVEQTGWVSAADGLVVKDIDGDGKINHSGELISEFFGGTAGSGSTPGSRPFTDGFAALRSLDTNQDNVFTQSEADANGVKVWVDADHDGVTDAGELKTFADLGITQIDLVSTGESGLMLDGNEVLATSTFTQIVGGSPVTREAIAANLTANPFGNTVTTLANGATLIVTQGDSTVGTTKVYVSASATGETINLATAADGSAVDNAFGGSGNDVLNGTALNNWLGGGRGSDTFNAGDGNDVLLIDADDLQVNIHAGAGFDIIQAVGEDAITINLTQAEAEVGQGGAGNDILIGGGRYTVYIRGGGGDDIVIGGAANDALSGEDGDDLIDGGQGNDVLRGDRGADALFGGVGQDVIHGGLGDDNLIGGADSDWLAGEQGDDTIDGGDGADIVQFTGSYGDYVFRQIDANVWRVVDRVAGRDGADIVKNVERIGFRDVGSMELGLANPMPARDVVAVAPTVPGGDVFLVKAADLLKNDLDLQGDALTLREIPVLSIRGGTIAGTISTVNGEQVLVPTLTANGELTFTRSAGHTGFMGFQYRIKDSQNNNGATVTITGTTQAAELKAQVILRTPDLPSDPLVTDQWYLAEANILPVWQRYTGKGVRIGQFEPGGPFSESKEVLDFRHPDLQSSIDAAWLASGEAGEGSEGNFSSHATRVAGVMVGARNGEGIVGVAYDAKIAGHWLQNPTGTPPAEMEALERMKQYDVVNNSWGAAANFDFAVSGGNFDEFVAAASQGRNALGTVIVMAGGNERAAGGNTNYSNLGNSILAITTGAIQAQGDLGALVISGQPYSNPGASILVSAPGSNVTSSSTIIQNNQGTVFGSSVVEDSGTSYATPIVSGIAALMLEANPNLGYRDVQEILALTSRQFSDASTDWHYNHANTWNGGAMHVSHDYGFGEVDALAAVRLAETWATQQTFANTRQLAAPPSSGAINPAIPDNNATGVTSALSVSGVQLKVEHATVRVNLTHARAGDLIIKLESPTGTESVLMNRPGKAPGSAASERGDLQFSGGEVAPQI